MYPISHCRPQSRSAKQPVRENKTERANLKAAAEEAEAEAHANGAGAATVQAARARDASKAAEEPKVTFEHGREQMWQMRCDLAEDRQHLTSGPFDNIGVREAENVRHGRRHHLQTDGSCKLDKGCTFDLNGKTWCVEEIVIINDFGERGVYAYDVESWASATLRADERCELFDGTVLARLEDEARQRRTFAEEEARQRRTIAKRCAESLLDSLTPTNQHGPQPEQIGQPEQQQQQQQQQQQHQPQPAQQGIGAGASRQKRGRQDDSSGGDARDDGGDDDGGDDDGGEARGGDAAMEGGEASGGSVATTGEDEASGGSMATTGDDGGDGGDGGAAAAPKKKKRKQSPAKRMSGNGSLNQRDVRHRAAADDSGA